MNPTFSFRVESRLKASIAAMLETVETKLLGKEEAALMGSIGHVERKSNIVQPVDRGIVELPFVTDESKP